MEEALPVAQPEGESKAERRRRKASAAEKRPLDSWERYRALSDLVDHMLDVIEMADRRTRFALVLVGTLNAVNLLIAVQADAIGATALNPVVLGGYVACYVLLSIYLMMQAVVALKPRLHLMGRARNAEPGGSALPGLRLVDDILMHKPGAFYELWRTTEIGTLNRELAMQVYLMAQNTSQKFEALRKVYTGVLILLALTAAFVAIVGLHIIAPTFV